MKQRITTLAAHTAALAGVAGEIGVLRHELIDSYPFKIMTYPPAHFFERVGNVGSVGVMTAASILAFVVVVRKSHLLFPPILTFAAPIIFAVIVFASTGIRYGFSVPPGVRNFDGYTVLQAASEFAYWAVGLAVAGLVIGSICSGILRSLCRAPQARAV